MILEDIPIFYLASKDRTTDFYWSYTGYSMFDKTKYNSHRHRVYFTAELISEIGRRVIPHDGPYAPGQGGAWDLIPPKIGYVSTNGWNNWLVKHSGGYVWKLHYARENRIDGYILGVWPD